MSSSFFRLLGSISVLSCVIASCSSPSNKGQALGSTASKRMAETRQAARDRDWWKEAIVYQIYPRSFKDSNGDGVGDLKGIISKLDYLKSLGINTVWLNPIYESPNFDNGYDVSNYYTISSQFGSMQDFDALLKGLHERGIKVLMDMVLNHSSDQHEWFKQSRSSRTNPYRNYYHWWNAERGKPTPRWSFFDVNSDAWAYDTLTNAYYLHYFARQQPDLNWENPAVRQEIYKMMQFWLDKGVDGFRMDAFQYVSKDTTFPILPKGYEQTIDRYYGAGPHLHDYIQEMNRKVLRGRAILTVAEGAGATMDDAMKFVDSSRHEFSMVYHFKGIGYGNYEPNYDLIGFKKIYSSWDSMFASKGWLSIYLANHDQPRMVSHWGNDDPKFRTFSSKMLTTFIMTMRGTPYYYYGDELGMDNIRFDRIEDYQDIALKNKYLHLKQTSGDLKAFIESNKRTNRDNGRTPFQWDKTLHAGFTSGTPWLKINQNYTTVNEADQELDSSSVLNYFRKIVKIRKNRPVLVYGKYTLVDAANPNIYAYTRELDGHKVLILLNFKSSPESCHPGLDLTKAKLLISNYKIPSPPTRSPVLQPYEAEVYEL